MKAIVKKPDKFNILATKQFADDEAQEDWFEAKTTPIFKTNDLGPIRTCYNEK